MRIDLSGKKAIVSGSTAGIGFGIARGLALAGAVVGTVIGMLAVLALPTQADVGFLTGLGFQGAEWLWLLILPPVAGGVAYLATRRSALRVLGELS